MKWTPVSDKQKYGVAIANFFSNDKPHRLQLTVGETVHILEENADWYVTPVTDIRACAWLRASCTENILRENCTYS